MAAAAGVVCGSTARGAPPAPSPARPESFTAESRTVVPLGDIGAGRGEVERKDF